MSLPTQFFFMQHYFFFKFNSFFFFLPKIKIGVHSAARKGLPRATLEYLKKSIGWVSKWQKSKLLVMQRRRDLLRKYRMSKVKMGHFDSFEGK